MKFVIEKIFTCLTILFVLICAVIIILPYFGIEPTIMTTSSMKSKIPVGSICFIDKKYSYEKIKVGDIISYKTPKDKVIHRVVKNTSNGYVVKGDDNKRVDSVYITKDLYYGKYVFSISYIGIVLTNNWSKYFCFFLISLIIFMSIINYCLKERRG